MKNTLLAVLFTLTLTAFAHNNEPTPTRLISGKVIDKQTGEALAGVKIAIQSTDTYCYTDLYGNFVLSYAVHPNSHLTVELTGYTPLTLKSEDAALEQDLFLLPR